MVASARAQSAPSRTDLLEHGSRPGSSSRPGMHRSSLSGDALESWVGRYGTLLAAAFVILLGVGTLVVWAAQRGLLSPQVRVAAGAVATACVAAAGLQFRRKGERRYGNVLLALSLAMTAVVAWGAGPKLHIGRSTYVNRFTMFDASLSIMVGAQCMIGPYCYITDHDHGVDEQGPISAEALVEAPVKVGNNVWIGAHAVKIGRASCRERV